MQNLHLALPWHLTRHVDAGRAILNRIGQLPESEGGPKITTEAFRTVIDWGVLRVFYRLAVGASNDGSAIQYGFYRHVPTGWEEVVVGAWDLREAHVVMDELLATWGGPTCCSGHSPRSSGKSQLNPALRSWTEQ